MKIGGFYFPKMDLALDAFWVFSGFYALFMGAWATAILSLAFILMHVSLVIQDNIIKEQSEVIRVLVAVIRQAAKEVEDQK